MFSILVIIAFFVVLIGLWFTSLHFSNTKPYESPEIIPNIQQINNKPLTQAVKPVTMGKVLPFRRKLK